MSEILKPDLVWIEGRCYRVNDPTHEVNALQEYDLYENGKIFLLICYGNMLHLIVHTLHPKAILNLVMMI